MNHESISRAASTTTYAGSTLAAGSAVAAPSTIMSPELILGLTLTQWSVLGIVFGMLMAVVGWATNLYYKRQHLQLVQSKATQDYSDGD